MLRSASRSLGGGLAFALTLAALGACEERLPRENTPPATLDDGRVPGLDARPVPGACVGRPLDPQPSRIALEEVVPTRFDKPVEVAWRALAQGGDLYVLEQGGKIFRLPNGSTSPALVLDLTSKVVLDSEAGLLGLAFHPSFAQNGFVYLSYTAPHPTQPPPQGVVFQSVVARFTSPDGGQTIDPASEKRILVVDQPFTNHNGGKIAFGPDGYLYFGLGDGGAAGDPLGAGQDKDSLLGKMLRIDVDGGDPYAIPPTNPFAQGGGRPEIYALGFRNPWRFSFDEVTGDLWAGDVGQAAREEIDKVVLGGNYGWRVREGKTCYQAQTCDATGLVDPVVDHGRDEMSSIVGGVVYRGAAIPSLSGKYVYADTISGVFFAIPIDEAAPTPTRLWEKERSVPTALALAAGEIVVTSYDGRLLRVVAPPAAPEIAPSLADTGCVDPADPKKPASGLFRYDVNVPQWLDGLEADRALAIPEGTTIELRDDRLLLPPGAIATRTIRDGATPLETQLLVRRPDGRWGAYAYAWRPDGTGADLVEGEATVTRPGGGTHRIVAREAFLACHGAAAGVTLGLELRQLERELDYGGRRGNVLATLEHVGLLARPVEPVAPLPRRDGAASPEDRARALLHVECASCHRGEGTDMDLRFGTPLAATGTCGVAGRVVPGDPGASAVARAMRTRGPGQMPPFGTDAVDQEGVSIVEGWIRSLPGCP